MLGASLAPATLWSTQVAVAQEARPPAIDRSLLPYASARDSVRLPDGRTFHLVCMGRGAPVVILSTGAADWSIDWNKVQPEVAKKTRVCAWDRAGFGLSTMPPKIQTVLDTTTDLQDGLEAARIPGPYVVVGMSLGAYESLLLIDRAPSKVVGMVLLDPTIPDQAEVARRTAPTLEAQNQGRRDPLGTFFEKCLAALRAGTVRPGGPDPDGCLHPRWPSDWPPELLFAMDRHPDAAAPEAIAAAMENTMAWTGGSDTLRQDYKLIVKPGRNYGSMPIVVLTAGEAPNLPPDFPAALRGEVSLSLAARQRGKEAYAALSTRGVHRIVRDSTHNMQQSAWQAVIEAIDQVVDEARASGSPKAGP